jgi:cytochrome b subunit of formate dehydrogenase
MLRFMGKPAPPPERFAKYPLENKLYHAAIIAAGLSAIVTGVFMMFRVRTIFFPRNPYLFGDMTWGMMYVLHGLAGVGLITLIMMHVYFGLRPEKREITKSMIFGWMDRDFYLKEHDPARWPVEASAPPISRLGRTTCCGPTFDFRPPTRSSSCDLRRQGGRKRLTQVW